MDAFIDRPRKKEVTDKNVVSYTLYQNGEKAHLVQSCANECCNQVERLLWADSEIPELRICVKCKGVSE